MDEDIYGEYLAVYECVLAGLLIGERPPGASHRFRAARAIAVWDASTQARIGFQGAVSVPLAVPPSSRKTVLHRVAEMVE